jgi:hypothetical protein
MQRFELKNESEFWGAAEFVPNDVLSDLRRQRQWESHRIYLACASVGGSSGCGKGALFEFVAGSMRNRPGRKNDAGETPCEALIPLHPAPKRAAARKTGPMIFQFKRTAGL